MNPRLYSRILAILLVHWTLFGAIDKGVVNFSLRDCSTGFSVSGTIAALQAGVADVALKSDDLGRVEFAAPPGTWKFLVRAPRFADLLTGFSIAAGETLNVRIDLDPIAGSMAKRAAAMPLFPGIARFSGFVVEHVSGRPLRDVSVSAEGFGASALSGQDGCFSLDCPARRTDLSVMPPPRVRLIFDKHEYQRVVRESWLLEGECRVNLAMEKKPGTVFYEKVHGLESNRSLRPAPVQQRDAPVSLKKTAMSASAAPFLKPPASIRVGTSCASGRTSCTGVQVMSLETYVGTGLDDEWIASWNAHSLAAGTVAYRSYGAYFVEHPASTNYDICSSSSCQVWQSDQYASVVSAAALTAGIMLGRDGRAAYTEYSAENNNAGCGDGWAGDGTFWPCNRDTVCSGNAKNGHGRGMCQWGSQRWASGGKTWTWIAEHYYRTGGYALSSPITISSVLAGPGAVAPGSRFTITTSVLNGSDRQLAGVLYCASLSMNSALMRDTGRDSVPVTVPAGAGTLSRPFDLPGDAVAGDCDLTVSLWLDANGNRAAEPADTGGDLLLARFTQVKALVVGGTAVAAGTKRPPETIAFRGGRCLAIDRGRCAVPAELLATDGAVTIVNMRGAEVRRLERSDVHGGSLIWDGLDGSGIRAPGSVYFLLVNHAGGRGTRATRLVKLP